MDSKVSRLVIWFCLALACVSNTYAQSGAQNIPLPDRKHLFSDDVTKVKKARSKRVQTALAVDKGAPQDIDVKADSVQFLKETNQVVGKGNMLITRDGLQAQANQGKVNMTTKQSELEGDVLISHSGGSLSAESATFDLEQETGKFKNADLLLEDGSYRAQAAQASKLSDTEYELEDSSLTTCQCEDSSKPWSLDSGRAHITQEGYAHTYNTALKVFGLPCLYAPYFAFPVKQERASGLLVPSYSYSSEDGVGLKLPVFVALSDSNDATITPFVQTNTRDGVMLNYRHAVSRYNSLNSKLLYSNERPRDGALRSTVVSDLFDPSIDEDRLGALYRHVWRSAPQAEVPLAFVSDVHYVSDDLFGREMEEEDILAHDARFATSTAILRATIGESMLAELSGEYNRSILTDDDYVFQRLPELNFSGSRSDRPFGFNSYGLKLTSSIDADATQFTRQKEYDGWRSDLYPSLRVPFHIKNYVASDLHAGFHNTFYALDQTELSGGSAELDSDQYRRVFDLGANASSAVERVYQLDPGNSLTYLTSLGSANQDIQLKRVKHVIEPFVRYTYVPDVEQEDLPVFDSMDRIRERSLFVFGARTSLVGRFLPTAASDESITELTPHVEDLPTLEEQSGLPDLGMFDQSGGSYSSRKGEIREIAYFTIKQAYDYKEHIDNNDLDSNAWSDTFSELGLSPTQNFLLNMQSNYSFLDTDPSSWAVAASFFDDRGDVFRARYSFKNDSINQIDGNVELNLAERLKLGYYARFDDKISDFIENRVALRLLSSCNCWSLDLGYSDRINPDKQQVFFTVTFGGLGSLTQGYGVDNQTSGS